MKNVLKHFVSLNSCSFLQVTYSFLALDFTFKGREFLQLPSDPWLPAHVEDGALEARGVRQETEARAAGWFSRADLGEYHSGWFKAFFVE